MPDFLIENDIISSGARFIAGIDEAGRGSLAGPLSVSMVIFPADVILNPPEEISEINDSKKLSQSARRKVFEIIKKYALCAEHVFIGCEEIDRTNINKATYSAIAILLKNAHVKPDFALIDGNFNFKFPVKSASVKKGDSLSLSIAAASVVAKVLRDDEMIRLSDQYPHFGFSEHMGYGTEKHIEAIRRYGACPLHRMSYAPMKNGR